MKMVKNILKIVTLILSFALMCGCNHILDTAGLRDETVYPPTLPADHPPPPKTSGSIYQSGHEITLYQDHIATRIGDILTVRLEEATQGDKKSEIKTSKVATNDLEAPILFGGKVSKLAFSTDTDQEFDGKGEGHQSNKLHGMISVTVMRVLSNRNLVVQGESWVTIDQGREYIRLCGIVRLEDIDANNVISSQRIADARISYSGSGQVGNATRGGILTQLLTKFFPY